MDAPLHYTFPVTFFRRLPQHVETTFLPTGSLHPALKSTATIQQGDAEEGDRHHDHHRGQTHQLQFAS
ncbi:unnamed protein product [Heligmosomoides polygyrus]|uniref:Uncharacterized protein n=1 Tax=Heligmosomoides polygyrus TaxID=6339 RepID=A0A183G3Z7_HELPZ|nr:unnamed protein product [Heligmosomoides polygyrus]